MQNRNISFSFQDHLKYQYLSAGWILTVRLKWSFSTEDYNLNIEAIFGIHTVFDSVVAITTGVCAGGLMIDKKQVLDVFADLPLR